jgi:hypothetical protein
MPTIHRELAPIVIGITGERELNGKHAAVNAALKRMFDCLDERYPTSPKILLTALAEGTDTLAAEQILDRQGWEIVAPLPMPLDLYIQGFDDRAASKLRALIEQAGSRKKLRMFTLDPLTGAAERQPLLSAADHYQQARLFIAERCAILIAVVRVDEKTDRIGDTARIARYRLDGNLDDAARSIVQRSSILLEPAPLDAPMTGPAWLVDLATVNGRQERTGDAEFTPLLPADDDTLPVNKLRSSLRLADRLNEFNIRTLQLHHDNLRRLSSAELDMPPPSASLHRLMDALSTIQMDMNRKLKSSFWLLAVLFCVAFAMFEAQIDLNKQWGVFGYIGALILGIAVYKYAWARRWQPFAQDYRAVAEALRVQIAWWNCGLVGPHHRVDRFFLRSTQGSLGLVRAALRHLIDATALRSCHEGHVADPIVQKADNDADDAASIPKARHDDAGSTWIEEQIAYFDDRLGKRITWVSFVEAFSWFFIIASLGPPVVVAVNTFRGFLVGHAMDQRFVLWRPGILFIAVVAAIILTFLLSTAPWAFSRSARADRTRRIFAAPNLAVSAVAGLLLAIGLYDYSAFIDAEHPNAGLLIFGGVSVAAIAYGSQFISDQLAWAAEMRGYEDALEVFRRARSSLKAIDAADIGAVERRARRDTVLAALGKEALKENESWLRAHRERPLEPLPPT